MLLLKQDTRKKGQVETARELDKGNSKEYKVKAICDNVVFVKKSESYISGLYYLVL